MNCHFWDETPPRVATASVPAPLPRGRFLHSIKDRPHVGYRERGKSLNSRLIGRLCCRIAWIWNRIRVMTKVYETRLERFGTENRLTKNVPKYDCRMISFVFVHVCKK